MAHHLSTATETSAADCNNSVDSHSSHDHVDNSNIQQMPFSTVYVEDAALRPPFVCRKSYTVLSPYKSTGFAGVTLKKTRNGQKAQSGVKLERAISPKRRTIS
mmetsp:Transcript_94121/g.130720  ORF Transcript_94121/g.130720 Transcript_94121/m.130720 type:complete len:103 (-) Transcript_94121:57-365(-)